MKKVAKDKNKAVDITSWVAMQVARGKVPAEQAEALIKSLQEKQMRAQISGVKINLWARCIKQEYQFDLVDFVDFKSIPKYANEIVKNANIIDRVLRAGGINPKDKIVNEKMEEDVQDMWETMDNALYMGWTNLKALNEFISATKDQWMKDPNYFVKFKNKHLKQ